MAGYPENYEKQEQVSDYLTLKKEGDYRIRILSDAIIGFETWEKGIDDNGNKKNIVHRCKTFQECVNKPSKDGKIKEFHAFIVWDYQTSMIRLLSVTQQYKDDIYAYSIDEDWGDLSTYDLVINRTGLEFNNTKYRISPKPKKPMADEIKEALKKVTIKEELYFEGGHPIVREDTIADDVAEALGGSFKSSNKIEDEIPF